MKLVLWTFAIFGLLAYGTYTVLHNGQLVQYLDTHPNPKTVPPLEYLLGEGYYVMQDLQKSATYYQRIAERYPQSTYADDAYFYYLQALDDMNTPRREMADAYATYTERFPDGAHKEVVLKRIENCRNNR